MIGEGSPLVMTGFTSPQFRQRNQHRRPVERRTLQVLVATGSLLPIGAGVFGMEDPSVYSATLHMLAENGIGIAEHSAATIGQEHARTVTVLAMHDGKCAARVRLTNLGYVARN